MACGACAAAAAAAANINRSPIIRNSESVYTIEQLQIWISKINCVKLQNKYALYNTTPTIINSYLGILGSAIRNPQNIGYFDKELRQIETFIIFLISKNDC